MGNLIKIIFIVLVVAVGGAGVFLATWDIPAPSREVESTIDNSQFPS